MSAVLRATALLLALGVLIGATLRSSESGADARTSRAILVDRPRQEGHPCRPEALAPSVPPGAVPFVVDVCVVDGVAKQTTYRSSDARLLRSPELRP